MDRVISIGALQGCKCAKNEVKFEDMNLKEISASQNYS
jgi:hypothetical protein